MDYDNSDKGFYDIELIFRLESEVDLYEQDRQRYLENQDGLSATKYDRAERFAKAVLKNSEQLIPVEEIDSDLSDLQYEISKPTEISKRLSDIFNSDLPWDKKRKLLCESMQGWPEPQSEDSPLRLVWERFIIDLSWEAVGKIKEGASRIFQLYNLVLCSAPSKSTQTFLSRLSRCFIWGFDPECIILCRAVIDTAFRDIITDEVCEKHFGKNNKYGFTLIDRIQAARKEEIIDEDIKDKALKIKRRGDKAVHYQPDITKDVWGTICDTVAILERITQKD